MSKPIIDALKGYAYEDDKLVKHRTAAITNIMKTTTTELFLKQVPENVFLDFIEALDNEDHVLYIEVGQYNHKMLNS